MASRIETLGALKSQISRLDQADDAAFASAFRSTVELLELTDQEFADALHVSRPTISRWSRGKNLPHRGLRGPILDWIGKELAAKVKLLERRRRPSSSGLGTRSAPTPMAAKKS